MKPMLINIYLKMIIGIDAVNNENFNKLNININNTMIKQKKKLLISFN